MPAPTEGAEPLVATSAPPPLPGGRAEGSTVGAFFADPQGRSFVLAFDTGQPEPPVSDCPTPDGPATTTTGGSATTGNREPTTAPPDTVPDTTLADTGAGDAGLIGAAVIFVLGGGIAMATARRRAA